MNKRYYVAYGSNLNLEQMSQRCPSARAAGTAALRDYRLLFRGGPGAVATVEPMKGSSVPVLLWEITPADEAALDRYEGFPFLYRKETVRVQLGRRTVDAMVYIMNGNRPLNAPGSRYYNVILEGYRSAGFDPAILEKAVKDSKRMISEKIVEQILAIRETGETNMFDVPKVREIAGREGFFELLDYLAADTAGYSRFILTGREDIQ